MDHVGPPPIDDRKGNPDPLIDRGSWGACRAASIMNGWKEENVKNRERDILDLLADGQFHSGESIGEAVGLTRGGVWKKIRELQGHHVAIDCVRGKGYRIPGGIEFLDGKLILEEVSFRNRGAISNIDVFDVVDSTNTVAQRMANLTSGTAYVCVAEQQLSGRGRHGRPWYSPYGRNVYLSCARQFRGGMNSLKGLSLAVGVSLCRAMESMGAGGLAMKWPNDVLHQGRKLAGILIEVSGDLDGQCLAVIGVGVNLRMAPMGCDYIDQPWTDLETVVGDTVPRNKFVSMMLSTLIDTLEDWDARGLETTIAEWSRFDLLKDSLVRISLGEMQVEGKVLGIDDSGALMLLTDDGVKSYSAGEVSVRHLK